MSLKVEVGQKIKMNCFEDKFHEYRTCLSFLNLNKSRERYWHLTKHFMEARQFVRTWIELIANLSKVLYSGENNKIEANIRRKRLLGTSSLEELRENNCNVRDTQKLKTAVMVFLSEQAKIGIIERLEAKSVRF